MPARTGSDDTIPTLCRNNGLSTPIAEWALLGASVLQRTIDRIKEQVPLVSVAGSPNGTFQNSSPTLTEDAAFTYIQSGVKRLLVIELRNYLELDVDDLVRCHVEKCSPRTEAVHQQEALGATLIEAKYLIANGTLQVRGPSALVPCPATYEFFCYRHRLSTPADYRSLTREALLGRCGITPYGREVQPQIWVAHGVRVSPMARLLAPCYVGKAARIGHGVLVADGSSVEQGSNVSCGAFVGDSTLLPETHVGPGLAVSQSIVAGGRLLHLGRDLEIELDGTGLLGYVHGSAPSLNNWLADEPVRDFGQSTPAWPSASLNRVCSWFAE